MGQRGFCGVYAMNDPIDRFFVGNLEVFLNKPLDELVIDPSNEELIRRHLPSLVYETEGKLSANEEHILGSAFYIYFKQILGQFQRVQTATELEHTWKYRTIFELKRGNEN